MSSWPSSEQSPFTIACTTGLEACLSLVIEDRDPPWLATLLTHALSTTSEPYRSMVLQHLPTILNIQEKQQQQQQSDFLTETVRTYCRERLGLPCKNLSKLNTLFSSSSSSSSSSVRNISSDVASGVTRALLCAFLCNQGDALPSFLQRIQSIHPYKSILEIKHDQEHNKDYNSWGAYTSQVHLALMIVQVLSAAGELQLNAELIIHEYLFLKNALPLFIYQRDYYFVGRIISALLVMGMSDEDSLIIYARSVLLVAQRSCGLWYNGSNDKSTGNDSDSGSTSDGDQDGDCEPISGVEDKRSTILATLAVLGALLPRTFSGMGPFLLPITLNPFLEKMAAYECSAKRVILYSKRTAAIKKLGKVQSHIHAAERKVFEEHTFSRMNDKKCKASSSVAIDMVHPDGSTDTRLQDLRRSMKVILPIFEKSQRN